MKRTVTKRFVKPTPILIKFNGQTLTYSTCKPAHTTVMDIVEYYADLSETPLELWHGNTKFEDDWAHVKGRENLILKKATAVMSSTPKKVTPAHHRMSSPGAIPIAAPYLTPREVYELGMRSEPAWHDSLEVIIRDDSERGVIAKKAYRAGEFICEFEANLLTKQEMELAEDEYNREGIPVYALEAHGYFFDPTNRPNAVGKYINHAATGANIKLFSPIQARGRIRVGFMSIKDIDVGEELYWDYGYRDADLPWTQYKRPSKPKSKLTHLPPLLNAADPCHSDPPPPGATAADPSHSDPPSPPSATAADPSNLDPPPPLSSDPSHSDPPPPSATAANPSYSALPPSAAAAAAAADPSNLDPPPPPSATTHPPSPQSADPSHSDPHPPPSATAADPSGLDPPLPSATGADPSHSDPPPPPPPSATKEPTSVACPDKPSKRKARRIPRPCPLPECNGILVANIWNHLFQTHKAKGKYTDEELHHYLKVAKMMVPTVRQSQPPPEEKPKEPTVHYGDNGDVSITRVEYKAMSAGRERFGDTLNWPQFGHNEEELVRFKRYIMGIEGGNRKEGSANQEVADLSKFLRFTDDSGCNIQHVSYMKNIVGYLNALRQSNVGPAGQIGKLSVLMHALQMLVGQVDEATNSDDDKQLIIRSTIVKTKVQSLIKSLRGEYKALRVQKRDMFDASSVQRDLVLQFLENKPLIELMEGYAARETDLMEEEKLRFRRFLTCSLLFRNAQRQAAVANLTLEENERAVQQPGSAGGEDMTIIKVWDHKTKSSFGHARLVIPARIYRLVQVFIEKARATPAEGCEDYVFLTPSGRRLTYVSDDLRLLSRDFPTQFGTINVTATHMRKLSATEMAKTTTDATCKVVAQHMTHDTVTARRHYTNLQSNEDSVAAFHALQRKRPAEEDEETKRPAEEDKPKHKMRRRWLREEEEVLASFFKLGTEGIPSLEACNCFLSENTDPQLFSTRSKKDIQDKCRTIVRRRVQHQHM